MQRNIYRLSPTLLNNLILSYLEYLSQEKTPGQLEWSSTAHSSKNHIEYVKLTKNLYVFPVTKDAGTPDNEGYLPYIGDVLKAALSQLEKELTFKLLIPMRQCRGALKLPVQFTPAQREHIVLVEVLKLHNIVTIHVHDSQKKSIAYAIYPDKLKEISPSLGASYNSSQNYHAYDKQTDEDLCGFYVYRYLKSTIDNGHSNKCRNILLGPVNDPLKNELQQPATLDIIVATEIAKNLGSEVNDVIENIALPISWKSENIAQEFAHKSENKPGESKDDFNL